MLHPAAEQPYAAQSLAGAGTHVPSPLQYDAGVNVDPEQLAATQSVATEG